MFCPNCGCENPDEYKYCRRCGTPISAVNGAENTSRKNDFDQNNDSAQNNSDSGKSINKTLKAVIIALTVLIFILLIVLGIVVYRKVINPDKTATSETMIEGEEYTESENVAGNSTEAQAEVASDSPEPEPVLEVEPEAEAKTEPEEGKLSEPYKITNPELLSVTPIGDDEEMAKFAYSCVVNGREMKGEIVDNYYGYAGDVSIDNCGRYYIYDVDKDGNDELIFHMYYLGNTLSETAGNLHILKIDEEGPEEILENSQDIIGMDNMWVLGVITDEDRLMIEAGKKNGGGLIAGAIFNKFALEYRQTKFTAVCVSSSLDPIMEALQAYDEFIKANDIPVNGVFVFMADNDDIPEVLLRGSSEAEGNQILSYKNGAVCSWITNRLGVGYVPGTGYFVNSDGHMGYYFDNIILLGDNGFENIGTYSCYEDADYPIWNEDGDYVAVMKYSWNDHECSEEEANAYYRQAFPYDKKDLVEIGYAETNQYGNYSSIEEAYLDISGEGY